MQDDGNLVVYDTNNKAIWSSNSKRAVPAGSKIPNVAVHSGNKNTVATGPSTSPIQGYGSCGTAGEALTSLCGAVLAGASVCGIVGSGAGMCGMVAGG